MTIQPIDIAGRKVGPGFPSLIIGEVAQAHDGSLGMAHSFIDAIADAGADAVKFQTHIAEAESSALEPFRVKFSKQDATRFDYWKRMEFSSDQWAGLAKHARERGLIFLSSPFSEAAVELLDRLGMPAWKIASGEVNNPLLFESLASTGKPVLLSSGMSPMEDLDRAAAWVRKQNLGLAVFQCTSAYPCTPDKVGLNLLAEFSQRYQAPVGLSDHTGKIYSGLAAVTMGASLIEVHVTLSREMFGPDVPASLTTGEFRQLIEGTRFIEQALASPVNKNAASQQMAALRQTFGKSLVARRGILAGTKLSRQDLTARKPGTGIPAARLDEFIGRTLRRDINEGDFLNENDIE
jgi:N-acetylneuraminate synthase